MKIVNIKFKCWWRHVPHSDLYKDGEYNPFTKDDRIDYLFAIYLNEYGIKSCISNCTGSHMYDVQIVDNELFTCFLLKFSGYIESISYNK